MKKNTIIIIISLVLLLSLSGCSEDMVNSLIEKGLEKATGVDESDVHIDFGDTSGIDKSLKGVELLKSIKLNPDFLEDDYKLSAETRMPVVGVVSKVKVFKKGDSYRKEIENDEGHTIRIYNADEDTTYVWENGQKEGEVYSAKKGDFAHFEDFSFKRDELNDESSDIADQNFENLLDTLDAGGIAHNAEIVSRYGGDVLKVSLAGENEDDDLEGEIALYMSLNHAFPIEVSAEVNHARIFTHIVTEFTVNPSNDDALFEKPNDVEFN